jgi:hypothetical protein
MSKVAEHTMLHHSHNRSSRRDPRHHPEGRGQANRWRTGHLEDHGNDLNSNMRLGQLTLHDNHASLGHERPRRTSGRQDREVDMQTVVRKLDATLKNAVRAGTSFINSFDQEISSIKHYTDSRIQDAIWVQRHAHHEQSTRSAENDGTRESFRKVQKQLAAAYSEISAARSLARHHQPLRSENVANDRRLCKRICDSKDILNVFNDGSQHRSSFEHFLTEARIVEAIIDSTSYLPGGGDATCSEQHRPPEGWGSSE